jgi:glycosyltransferase involved in cell wall biosynthesis
MARSGVYRSTYDLVTEGRRQGFDWTALIGLRETASGESPSDVPEVFEFTVERHGRQVVDELVGVFSTHPAVAQADVVVTLITQSDLALNRMRSTLQAKWVAFVRGLPWPDRGEQSLLRRTYMRRFESSALRRADEVWATTPILAAQIASARRAEIVPAGVPSAPRISHGADGVAPLIWAGRVDVDKRPGFFVDLVDSMGLRGRMYGTGPLESEIAAKKSAGVTLEGWAAPGKLWLGGSLYLGTSSREAFGRSAVEAAQAGLPIILTDQYGAAEFLFTDPELKTLCVLPTDDAEAWRSSIRRLLDDDALRRRISDHVHANASTLTIEASAKSIETRIRGVLGDTA